MSLLVSLTVAAWVAWRGRDDFWWWLAWWCVPPRAMTWGRLTKGDPIQLWFAPTLAEINAGTDLTPYLRDE